jgi:hypothetical protein
MKKELIRSLAAINQATTGMIMNRQQPLRSTTVSLKKTCFLKADLNLFIFRWI